MQITHTASSMEKIKEIWFENNRIYMRSKTDAIYSRPLEAFPTLKDANATDRQKFYIWGDGEYVRWRELDEDLSVESFMETAEPNPDNEVAKIFRRCPWLNVREFAKFIGMPKSVLDRFIYGIWQPKDEAIAIIKNGIMAAKKEMSAAVM